MKEIKFPEKKTYYIAYTDIANFIYGSVDTNQHWQTPHETVWITTLEPEWLVKLKMEFDTDPYKELQEPIKPTTGYL
jgi:hypothetical protein